MKTETRKEGLGELTDHLPDDRERWVKIKVRGPDKHAEDNPEGFISVERRAGYCDRGNFLAKLCIQYLSIDAHDGFPRYYFHADCLVKELEAWMEARELELVGITMMKPIGQGGWSSAGE